MVPVLPADMAPHPTARLQPLHPSALHKLVYFRGGREHLLLSPFGPKKVSVLLTEGLGERDGSGPGKPHLHVELLPVALCVLHQQLQRILVAALRLLAGHLGTDVLLDLGVDDVARPQALTEQQGEQRGTWALLALPPLRSLLPRLQGHPSPACLPAGSLTR